MNEQKIYITPKFDYWPAEELDKIEARMSGGGGSVGPKPPITSMVIFESDKPKEYDEKGKKAEDLISYNYSKEELVNINKLFSMQTMKISTAQLLFSDFMTRAIGIFSAGEMLEVVFDMINHFRYGNGEEYSNPILTRHARKHESTKTYMELVKNKVIDLLKDCNGDIRSL